jgi:CBS domain-containing protein
MSQTMTRAPRHMTVRVDRPTSIEGLGTVGQAMSMAVVPVTADTLVGDALVLLDGYGVSCAPVINYTGRVVGLVTRSDLERRLGLGAFHSGPFLRRHRGQVGWYVADVMTQSGVIASADEPLGKAIVRMAEAEVDRIAVVETDGRPVGLMSHADLIKAVARWIRGDTPDGGKHGERRPFLE